MINNKIFYTIVLLLFYINSFSQIIINQPDGSADSTYTINCDTTYTYYDDGGTSDYNNNVSSTFVLKPSDASQYVSVNFSSFDLEENYDYLYVYDGDNTTYLIGGFTGTDLDGFSGGYTITSSDPSGALTFVFVSDGATVSDGWEASVSCSSTQGTNTISIMQPASGTFNVDINCNNTYYYYDTGGENDDYGNNETSTIVFTPSDASKYVSVSMDASFLLENGYDFLYLYDGNTTNYLIGLYTSENFKSTTRTSSDPTGALTFVFTSDNYTVKSGWAAEVSCSSTQGNNSVLIIQPESGTDTITIECNRNYLYYDPQVYENYDATNQTSILTICPDDNTKKIVFGPLTGNEVCLNSDNDYFCVYDTSFADPNNRLDSLYNCNILYKGDTATSSSGCLTFKFYSDGNQGSNFGWEAEISCGTITLPIQLISFDAKLVDSKVILKWITQTEINNEFFIIERSTDAINFEPILTIEGAGNSNEVLNYSTVDKYPLPSISYYRLKQVDYDGKYTYSNIIAVNNFVNTNDITINQFGSKLQIINSADQEYHISIIDAQGKTVYNKNNLIKSQNIDLSFLNKGVYFVRVFNNKTIKTKKIIL